MSGRPWIGAVGLRGRIAGAILVTAVVALAVAAVVLLGPLENSLRSAAQNTLKQQVPVTAAASFARYDPSYVPLYHGPKSAPAATRNYNNLVHSEYELGSRIGAAEVAVLGYPDPNTGASRPVVAWTPDADQDIIRGDPKDDARKVFDARRFTTGAAVYNLGSINGVEYARAAIPFATVGPAGEPMRWVLVVRKVVDVNSAVSAVRTAFLIAALVALALTLMLGVPLSARIVRRLRALRQAAVRLATEGPAAEVNLPVDRDRDEVGDLARTFQLMQRQLLHQEEARRAFVATASHELRTPLTTLDGMLELLDEDLKSGDPDLRDAQDLLERARAQSKRLARLAADLLDLSRLDAEVVMRSEPLELGELSRAVLAEFDLGTAYRSITTVLDDGAGPVWALGDPGGVAQILRILLDNALRLSPDGSEVTVELRNGQAASLSVRDSGPGVPSEERELIFERFIRGRRTAGQSGFGLGLAIGRELAERMGGELVLEEQDAPGATFTLRLPVAKAPQIEPLAVS